MFKPNYQRNLSNTSTEIFDLLDLIHSNICDSCRTPTKVGNLYFITFIDNHSCFCYIYLIKSKDEALSKFMIFKAEAENQLGKTYTIHRSNKDGEHTSYVSVL